MEDRYKYRAIEYKVNGTAEFVYGSLAYIEGTYFIIPENIEYDEELAYEAPKWIVVNPETIGQCTGLKDKNGVLIFDGAILSILLESGEKSLIICKFGDFKRHIAGNDVQITGFYFNRLIDNLNSLPIIHNYCGKTDFEIMEIIGNIHQNPELLEG